ncbi:MAG: DUF1832 domain-containing protein [Proteobacteria bacterium]|nr:DUF1832 domain-containing protein [Pseudomonadota bacterium]NBP15848.1 DUF1832 domain-containing protein [bacterium]
MRIKTSVEVGDFIEDIYSRVAAINPAIIGRSGLFYALGKGVPVNFKPKDASGKELNEETILGQDFGNLIKCALNHRFGSRLDEETYKKEFRRYFEYGCIELKRIWLDTGHDQVKFIGELLKICKPNIGIDNHGVVNEGSSKKEVIEDGVYLALTEDQKPWLINKAGGNSLMVISGQPGRGKSQLALELLTQMARQGVKFLFFDLKGELEEAEADNKQKRENRKRFFELTNATYIKLISGGSLPINPFYRGKNTAENANIASGIASLIRSFGPQMSVNQENEIRLAYSQLAEPDIESLHNQLVQNNATGTPIAIIDKIRSLQIFSDAATAIEFSKWIQKSIVIDFKKMDNDTKVLCVAFILNYFIERLNTNLAVKNGIQPLQMVLFVDEAHNILPKDNKARILEKLAREGRSWGFPLWLASQDADKFVTKSVDFSELASAGIHFSPETLNPRQQNQICGRTVSGPLKEREAIVKISSDVKIAKARQFHLHHGEIIKS